MPDSSGDSPNQPPADPSGEPSPTSQQKENLARIPRANPASVFNPKDAPAKPGGAPPGAPPGFAEFMAWMQSAGAGGAVEEPPAGKTRIPREQKKFSRRVNEPAAPEAPPEGTIPGGDGSDAPGTATGEKKSEAPLVNIPLEGVEYVRRKDTPFAGSFLTLLLQVLGLLLVVGAFFLGRATVPKAASTAPVPTAPAAPGTAPDDKTPAPLSAELQTLMNNAIQAESNSDFGLAKSLYDQIQSSGGRVHGLTLHLAQLAYFQGNIPQAVILLNESIAKGEEVAACYNLRGSLANRTGGVNKGIGDMELAAKLDPFNARYAFFVGEAMRRMGKTQAALDYLHQALYRLREPALYHFYELKIRLALIELGREKEFADEMTKQLAETPPPVDWLFTAAAVELQHGKSAAAVPFLEKAQSLVPQDEMDMRLRDFFFFGFSQDKEVGRFYASIKAAARGVVPVAPALAPTSFGSPAPAISPGTTPPPQAPNPLETPKVP